MQFLGEHVFSNIMQYAIRSPSDLTLKKELQKAEELKLQKVKNQEVKNENKKDDHNDEKNDQKEKIKWFLFLPSEQSAVDKEDNITKEYLLVSNEERQYVSEQDGEGTS
ncbi:6383_t:CDS:2, partial [Diversispora eburnea]